MKSQVGLAHRKNAVSAGGAGCGKTLFSMEFLVNGATQHNEPGVFVTLEESTEELAQNVASLGFDLKELSKQKKLSIDLNPVVLHGEGLAEAMSWLAFRMKEQYGLQMELEAKESFNDLDHPMRMLLFQSIRELLFNVVKHAGTLETKVTLEKVAVVLPHTSGIELVSMIHEKYPELPCLMISGRNARQYVERSLEAGARLCVER